MVRRLERRDSGLVEAFLRRRLPHSFPILGAIERERERGSPGELWGCFARNELTAVLARLSGGAHVCGPDETDAEELEGVGLQELDELDGRLETVESLAARVSRGLMHRQYLAFLQDATFVPRTDRSMAVSRALPADAAAIAALWCRRLEPAERARTERILRSRLEGETDRICVGSVGGVPVTTASTGQESRSLALIRCTYTDPDLRGLGLATACLSALCRSLLAEGKTVVVLTETLADARIYRSIGFVPAGLWVEWRRKD